jgi:hypothetical protein
MSTTVTELFKSTGGDNERRQYVCLVDGAADADAARTAVLAAAPTVMGTLVRGKGGADVEPLGPSLWAGRVDYVPYDQAATPPGGYSFSGSTGGGSQRIMAAKAGQTTSYAAGGTGTAEDYHGAIGIRREGNALNVEGVVVTVPVFRFTVTRYIAAVDMTTAHLTAAYACTGRVNSAAFSVSLNDVGDLTFAAREVLLLSVDPQERPEQADWVVTYQFAAQPNQTDQAIGTITGIDWTGWDVVDVVFEEVKDPTTGLMVKVPSAVYVHQVYDGADFSQLGDLTWPGT